MCGVRIHDLTVVLSDGRTVTVPLIWFPRLVRASAEQRTKWELIGGGIGIHWEALDEDISVASLLQPENFMRLADWVAQPTSRAWRRAKKQDLPAHAAECQDGITRPDSVFFYMRVVVMTSMADRATAAASGPISRTGMAALAVPSRSSISGFCRPRCWILRRIVSRRSSDSHSAPATLTGAAEPRRRKDRRGIGTILALRSLTPAAQSTENLHASAATRRRGI